MQKKQMNKFLNVTNHWLIGLLIRKAFEITGSGLI